MDYRRRAPATYGQARPGFDLVGIVEYRNQASRDELLARTGEGAVQHGDLRLWAERLAQRDPLVERRDKEPVAPRGNERPRHSCRAKPITVGLNDRGANGGRGVLRERPPIGGDGAKIDLQNGAGAGGGIGSHRSVSCLSNCLPAGFQSWPSSQSA